MKKSYAELESELEEAKKQLTKTRKAKALCNVCEGKGGYDPCNINQDWVICWQCNGKGHI